MSDVPTPNNHKQAGQNPANPVADIPAAIRAELHDIGWSPTVPIPTHYPWDALLAFIRYAKRERSITKKAGFVHARIKDGTLMRIVAEKGLLGDDPNGTLGAPLPAPARMDALEYDQLAEQHPAWAQAVEVEATRQAALLGEPYVRPLLRWQVAATMPPPDNQTTGRLLG